MSRYDLWKETQADGYDPGHRCDNCPSDEGSYDWHGGIWLCDECAELEEMVARQPDPA